MATGYKKMKRKRIEQIMNEKGEYMEQKKKRRRNETCCKRNGKREQENKKINEHIMKEKGK